MYELLGRSDLEACVYRELANVYAISGNFEEEEAALKKSLALFQRLEMDQEVEKTMLMRHSEELR